MKGRDKFRYIQASMPSLQSNPFTVLVAHRRTADMVGRGQGSRLGRASKPVPYP